MAIPTPYWEAHETTESVLRQIAGLSTVILELALMHSDLSRDNPSANAITSLMGVLKERAKQALRCHDAGVGPQTAGEAATNG